MTPTRFLVGQIPLVCAIVIGGLWLSTQRVAAALGYQPRLGLPWFEVLSLPVYYPWRLFVWWYAFDAYTPTVFNKSGIMTASSGVAGIVVAVIGSLWRARQSRLATTYGSSRWASRPEVEAASLFQPAGVFLGRHGTGICDTTGRSNEAVETAAHSEYRQRRRALLQSTAGSDDSAALADPGITMPRCRVARRSVV